MRGLRVLIGIVFLAATAALTALPVPRVAGREAADQGLVIDLDNEFINKYENRATITSEYKIGGLSGVHPPAKDGEVHVGGFAYEAGLPCVAEVMNAANKGTKARLALARAAKAGQKVTVTGAWRLWGEHPGTAPQLQALGSDPAFPLPGEYPSNPDHVFEIHPVTLVKLDGQVTEAAGAIGDTPGFTPHDPQKAFVQGYEKLTCKIVPKNGRTRLITQSLGFNFTEFVIRLNENPSRLEDGHGVICSVFDTDGELLVKGRRMVFVQGTAADDEVAAAKTGDRLRVTGIPRISLKLIRWRLDHYKDQQDGQPKWDISPLDWHLPYEMIVVAAAPVEGNDD